MAKVGFAAVISPVSVADKAKIDAFDLEPDLDLTCHLLNIFFPKKKHSLLPLYAATAAGSQVSRGGGNIYPLPVPRVRLEAPALRTVLTLLSQLPAGVNVFERMDIRYAEIIVNTQAEDKTNRKLA